MKDKDKAVGVTPKSHNMLGSLSNNKLKNFKLRPNSIKGKEDIKNKA